MTTFARRVRHQARQALALLVSVLDAGCAGATELEEAGAEQFRKHPDYAVITDFPASRT
ncbi:hypothetical protein ACQP2U_23140 [Nocardia sp. CA-084685]|uniref:hypothetical protein n=1 Tax=Nocardia sp. CA-084685 TaxID=3239970 RepID=UPI003D95209B